MMKKKCEKYFITVIIAALFIFALSVTEAASVKGSFVYRLSNFSGPVPYDWARVFVDREKKESYVLYQNFIRVFDKNGMEIYRFGDDLDLGAMVDAAIDENGNFLILTYSFDAHKTYIINVCNYRGLLLSKISVKGLPQEFSKFSPGRIVYHKGDIYLASLNTMKIAVVDSQGNFKDGYDLGAVLKLDEQEKADNEMVGFSVDNAGNILFTVPTLFKAYVVTPDRKVSSFGRPGGAPGRFAIVAGIISDGKGHYLVADKLKCVISVFDKDFNFIAEFGHRGMQPGNLIAPDDIALDNENRIYVTQGRNRGVNVYRLDYE